jgi:uncharacterized repeat protein (TIGR04044 family)
MRRRGAEPGCRPARSCLFAATPKFFIRARPAPLRIDRALIARTRPRAGTSPAKEKARKTCVSNHPTGVPMPKVTRPRNEKGEFLVDYEEKVFEDVKADPGEKALVTFHTVAFEGSIGFVNLLQATRLRRKGYETSVLLYGPGVTLGVQRGFPTLGDEAFPGHQNFNKQISKFMEEGGKVYACRFALQALYGHGEGALIEGITPINPLDVLDLVLLHKKAGAVILDTWTL